MIGSILLKKIAEAFDLNPEMIHETTTDLNQSRTRPMKVKMKLDKLKSSISTKILSLDEQLDSMRNNYHVV